MKETAGLTGTLPVPGSIYRDIIRYNGLTRPYKQYQFTQSIKNVLGRSNFTDHRYFVARLRKQLFIDRISGRVMHLVGSVCLCPCVCVYVCKQ